MSGCCLTSAETLLNVEIAWLKNVRDYVKENGEIQVDEALLESHLKIV
jgi:ubiquitin carboxyl-terminal hydrolase 9/24